MTKFQIISPNGVKVCIIEAVSKVTIMDRMIVFYGDVDQYNHAEPIAEIPSDWVALPLEVIADDVNKTGFTTELKPKYRSHVEAVAEFIRSKFIEVEPCKIDPQIQDIIDKRDLNYFVFAEIKLIDDVPYIHGALKPDVKKSDIDYLFAKYGDFAYVR
jgi:hypothetical protein